MRTNAIAAGLASIDVDVKETLAARRSEKSARNEMLNNLPDWRSIREQRGHSIQLSVETNFEAEIEIIDKAILENDLNSITNRFAIKKSRVPSVIAETLRFSNRRHYEEAVVTLAKNDEAFRDALRAKLAALTSYLQQLDQA